MKSIQRESLHKRIDQYLALGQSVVPSFTETGERKIFLDLHDLQKRKMTSKSFIKTYLGHELKSFRHYELREYIRVLKTKTIQQFIQFYTNYHFLYLTKYMTKVEEDKLRIYRALDIKEPDLKIKKSFGIQP